MGTKTYSQGDVVQQNVESRRSYHQVLSHEPTDALTLGDELTGVELCHDGLQHFVHDRRKHTLVVIGAEGTVDNRESINAGTGEDTAGDIDHLKIYM